MARPFARPPLPHSDRPPLSILLTQGKLARVDADDAEWLSAFKWRVNSGGYAIRSFTLGGKEVVVCMHREIMRAPQGLCVDHIDHDRLNNVRANLRLCTASENMAHRGRFRNSSTGFIGVSFQSGRWRSQIQIDDRILFLGLYDTLRSAALVRDHAAKLLFKTFAMLNLPDERIPLQERQWAEQRLRQYGFTIAHPAWTSPQRR